MTARQQFLEVKDMKNFCDSGDGSSGIRTTRLMIVGSDYLSVTSARTFFVPLMCTHM